MPIRDIPFIMWDFASGIIATVLVSTFKSFGIETEARLIWSSGNDAMLLGLLFVLFAGMSVVAVLWRGKDTLLGYEKLLGTTGNRRYRLPAGIGRCGDASQHGTQWSVCDLLCAGSRRKPKWTDDRRNLYHRWIQCNWKTFAEYFSRSWRASTIASTVGRGISRIRRHFWRCSFPRRWRRSPESLEFYAAC